MTPFSASWILLVQTFLVTLLAVFLVKRLGLRMGWVDIPKGRKIHDRPVVTAGGLGIFAGLLISFGLFHLWFGDILTTRNPSIT